MSKQLYERVARASHSSGQPEIETNQTKPKQNRNRNRNPNRKSSRAATSGRFDNKWTLRASGAQRTAGRSRVAPKVASGRPNGATRRAGALAEVRALGSREEPPASIAADASRANTPTARPTDRPTAREARSARCSRFLARLSVCVCVCVCALRVGRANRERASDKLRTLGPPL